MKLEGIHHITAITADAQDNIDFYAGVLGLRLVKKTVNQDDPSVYHLFFADEQGSAGSDLTFFEFPGAPRGRAGDGMVHDDRLARRLRGGARLLGRAARRPGIETKRGERHPRLRGPRGPAARAAVVLRRRRAADRRPPRGPGGARAAAASTASAPSRSSPEAQRSGLLARARLRDASDRSGETPGRRAAKLAAALSPTTRRPPSAACRAPAPSTTSPGPRRRRSTRPGASASRAGGARPTPVIDRFYFQLDLLPRAERRAVRDRDARARLHRRRAARVARREALAAARLRAPARRRSRRT